MMYRIEVIIPTYNSSRTIERAIRSVMNQEGIGEKFFVFICMYDDWSTDDTVEKVEKIRKETGFPMHIIRLTHHTGGPNEARNRGIRTAMSDLIAFLDHDDEWLPDKLIKQIEQINQGYEFVYSRCIKKVE